MKRLFILFLLLPLIVFGQTNKLVVRDGKILMRHNSIARTYQVFYIGMSITAGVGTAGTGSSNSGLYEGPNAYPVKADSLLINVNHLNITPVYRVFPGETASWYIDNDLTTTISLFDYDHFTDIYCIIDFGTNDLAGGVSTTQLLTNIEYIAGRLKAAGAKVLVMPVLNRKDALAPSGLADRGTYNTSLFTNYGSFADGICDVSIYPNIYSDSAPDNATYFAAPDLDGSSKVHPTSAGAFYISQAVQTAVAALAPTTPIPITPVDYAGNFITATGITDATQQSAIRTLVSSLVSSNLWHRFAAFYPFVGGTSTTEKYNLKDPRDLDTAYRLTFTGSPTFNSSGVTWVSSSYGDTHFFQTGSQLTFQNTSLHYYSEAVTSAGVDMGLQSGSPVIRMAIKFSGNSFTEINEGSASGVSESYSDIGLFSTSRANSATVRSWYRNGILIRNTTASMAGPNPGYSIWIGGQNSAGTLQYPSNRTCGFAAIGYGLTGAEQAALYTIINAYETTLGR